MRRAVFLLPLSVFLTACGIQDGVVTSKSYVPEHTYTTITTINGCPCYPVIWTDPECWEVDFAKGDDTNDACLSKVDWDRYNVGDRIRIADDTT